MAISKFNIRTRLTNKNTKRKIDPIAPLSYNIEKSNYPSADETKTINAFQIFSYSGVSKNIVTPTNAKHSKTIVYRAIKIRISFVILNIIFRRGPKVLVNRKLRVTLSHINPPTAENVYLRSIS